MSAENLPVTEAQLVANRVHCSILIHEKTNDHMYDHTEVGRWLGTPLELNLEFLRNIKLLSGFVVLTLSQHFIKFSFNKYN